MSQYSTELRQILYFMEHEYLPRSSVKPLSSTVVAVTHSAQVESVLTPERCDWQTGWPTPGINSVKFETNCHDLACLKQLVKHICTFDGQNSVTFCF